MTERSDKSGSGWESKRKEGAPIDLERERWGQMRHEEHHLTSDFGKTWKENEMTFKSKSMTGALPIQSSNQEAYHAIMGTEMETEGLAIMDVKRRCSDGRGNNTVKEGEAENMEHDSLRE